METENYISIKLKWVVSLPTYPFNDALIPKFVVPKPNKNTIDYSFGREVDISPLPLTSNILI